MKNPDARTLLNITQNLRIHWSDNITKHFNYAIITFSAIWSYFFREFVSHDPNGIVFLVAAAAITSIFLGMWRVSTRSMDESIAGLYGDFVYYENELGVPDEIGTWEYLERHVFPNDWNNSDLDTMQKRLILKNLWSKRLLGNRGHLGIDRVVVSYIFISIVASFYYLYFIEHTIEIVRVITLLLIVHYFGLALSSRALRYHQKDPNADDIEAAMTPEQATPDEQ